MRIYNYIFLISLLTSCSTQMLLLEKNKLPEIVKNLIQNEEKSCFDIEGLDNKPGLYKVRSSLQMISYLNHDIEYIVHSSKDQTCSSSASLFQPNGGFYLVIFANYNNKWQKIFSDLIYDYNFVTPTVKNFPTNIIIHSKGDPGFTTNEIEFEWNQKDNCYVQKRIKKDIYNLK